jgi:hypothetical protein
LNANRIEENAAPETALSFRSRLVVGSCAGEWNPHGDGPNLPDDQRADDGLSLCFETDALREDMEILGAPIATLELASDRPNAFLAVRLNDVAPTGESTRITYGLLNLTHRDSHEFPQALEPGRRYRVRIQLKDIAYSLPAGHRIRLALSTSYWLLAWPSPESVVLTVFAGASRLTLPVRRARPETDEKLAPFSEPELPAGIPTTFFRRPAPTHIQIRDAASCEVQAVSTFDRGAFRLHDVDVLYDYSGKMVYRLVGEDPLSADMEFTQTQRLDRDNWKIRTETRARLTSTREDFLLSASVEAFEGDTRVYARVWNSRVPREFL